MKEKSYTFSFDVLYQTSAIMWEWFLVGLFTGYSSVETMSFIFPLLQFKNNLKIIHVVSMWYWISSQYINVNVCISSYFYSA